MVPSNPRGGDRLHDLHPPISAAGLFWTVPVPPDGLTVGPDGRSATVEIKDLAVVDQPNYPDRTPTRPATVSLRLVWTTTDQAAVFSNPLKQFSVKAHHARVQAEFSVAVPESGFSWKSDPPSTSRANFALIGEERNGFYFAPAMPDVVALTEGQAKALLGNLSITDVAVKPVKTNRPVPRSPMPSSPLPLPVVGQFPRRGASVEPGTQVLLRVQDM